MVASARAAEIGLVAFRRDPESVMVQALVATAQHADFKPLESLPRMQ